MYYHGEGGPKDFHKALSWYLKAANLGFLKSKYSAAMMLLEGDGVNKDEDMAKLMLEEASELGSEKAKNVLKKLKEGR